MTHAHTQEIEATNYTVQQDQPRYLPRTIQRALDRVVSIKPDMIGQLLRPVKTNQLLLQQLIRCADAIHHQSPIAVRKDTFASLLGVSKPTVDRSLKALEEGGWIARKPQCKSRRRGFQIGEIVLTAQAVDYLFPSSPSSTQGNMTEEAIAHKKDLCESKTMHALHDSTVLQTASLPLEDRHPAALGVFDRSRAQQIEPNLRVLLDYFSPKTINWLKGQARDNRKMLEHVVMATQHHFPRIKKLKAYLLACIKRETDFEAVIRQRTTKQTEQVEKVKTAQVQRELQEQSTNQLYQVQLDKTPYALVEDTGLVSVFTADPREPGANRAGTMTFSDFVKKILNTGKAQSVGRFTMGEFYAKLMPNLSSQQGRVLRPSPSNITKIVRTSAIATKRNTAANRKISLPSPSMIFI